MRIHINVEGSNFSIVFWFCKGYSILSLGDILSFLERKKKGRLSPKLRQGESCQNKMKKVRYGKKVPPVFQSEQLDCIFYCDNVTY